MYVWGLDIALSATTAEKLEISIVIQEWDIRMIAKKSMKRPGMVSLAMTGNPV